jgi:phage shock protein A
MADGTSDAVESATLEGPAAAWLGDRAEELGIEPSELLKRVVAAYRSVEDGDLAADVITREDAEELLDEALGERVEQRLDDVESGLADVESDVADVEDRVADAEDNFDEKLQDVRERVIQVKREADEKADDDHDHPELSAELDDAMATVAEFEDAMETVTELEAETEDLADEVAAVSDHVDRGFNNFEEVLTYLRDEVDDLHHRTTALASAMLSMRESLRALGAAEARRKRAERIQKEANVAGVKQADCAECEQSVTIGQLTAPECPFCGAAFEDVQPKDGWFGSHTLQTGTTPALPSGQSWMDGESDDGWLGGEGDSLEEMVAEEDEGDDSGDEPIAADPVDADAMGSDADTSNAEEMDAEVVDVEDAGPTDATDQRTPAESDGGEPATEANASPESGDEEVTDG